MSNEQRDVNCMAFPSDNATMNEHIVVTVVDMCLQFQTCTESGHGMADNKKNKKEARQEERRRREKNPANGNRNSAIIK